jgi:probable metal-binding protein
MESIHGHEVMRMMLESGGTYTEEQLEKAVIEKFGGEARFHTCSASNLDAKGIVAFLKGRDKFVGGEEGFTTAPDKICGHE